MRRILVALVVAVFVASPAFPFGQNKIVYDKFHWNIYHSTHFDVYFYDEEKDALQKVVNMAESAYDDLSRKFNFQISKKIPLLYYHTHSAFEQTNVDLNFIPEGVGAFAEPARNRMVIPIDTTDEKLLQLVQHELTHIFEYELLFQGKLGKEITSSPPTWMMEGLASFMASDEDSKDRMVLRDAVVNDQIPPITHAQGGGYFAYRFGHAVFQYIQQKYGWDGLRDFLYEYRNTLGNSVDKALKRAFDVTPDEFDTRFRTWLRKQYLPALVSKGEPQEYGEPFKIGSQIRSEDMSPVPSPSGDLIAAITDYKEDADVVLFNVPERRLLRNLTPGYTSKYEYAIVQMLTTGPVMGRDLAFAPNGDQVALFVKKERGRNLLLINALNGRLERSVRMDVEQQLAPSYSPDGKRIAFAAYKGDQPDIFIYDIGTGDIKNVTNDRFFDGAPTFSPDGKWLVYSSVMNGYAKLIRLNLSNPAERYQITTGEWNDIDAWFAPDGKRIFFASDRQTGRNVEKAAQILQAAEDKAKPAGEATPPVDPANFASYNIYSLNLENGDLLQYTDVVGGCFTPVVFTGQKNKERLVFASYYKLGWRLYSTTTDKPLHAAEKTTIPSGPLLAESRTQFQPPVEVAVDPEKVERPGGFKLFVDDVQVNAGFTSDQLLVSQSQIFMSDMLGNRRFIATLESVSSFSNFDFLYFDLSRRTNWGIRAFDNRSFYATPNTSSPTLFDRHQLYRETGLTGIVSYPLDRYHRLDAGGGYESRSLAYPFYDQDGNLAVFERKDNFPIVSGSFTGDTAVFKEFGPISGHRYEIGTAYSYDLKNHAALSNDYTLDARQYLQVSSRTLLAARVFAGYSRGTFSNFYYFGGLNTVRGVDFRSIIGSRAAFANLEFRFPLIDVLAAPWIVLQNIRGNLFFDIGGAKFPGQPYTFMKNGRLVDGVAAVGYGLSFNLLGVELHWDIARRTDLKHTVPGGNRTEFWIGQTF
jgi:Tol biopolymer transport system component